MEQMQMKIATVNAGKVPRDPQRLRATSKDNFISGIIDDTFWIEMCRRKPRTRAIFPQSFVSTPLD